MASGKHSSSSPNPSLPSLAFGSPFDNQAKHPILPAKTLEIFDFFVYPTRSGGVSSADDDQSTRLV